MAFSDIYGEGSRARARSPGRSGKKRREDRGKESRVEAHGRFARSRALARVRYVHAGVRCRLFISLANERDVASAARGGEIVRVLAA